MTKFNFLLILFLISGSLFSQCCCADLEFNMVYPSRPAKSDKIMEIKVYDRGGSNRRNEVRTRNGDDEKIHRISSATGCGFRAIIFEIPFKGELMKLSFTSVPGDLPLYMGNLDWKKGTYEIHIPDLMDANFPLVLRDDMIPERREYVKLYMINDTEVEFEYPFEAPYPWINGENLVYEELTWDIVQPELESEHVVRLQVEKWIPQHGWSQQGKLDFIYGSNAIKWPFEKSGRFRLVYKGAVHFNAHGDEDFEFVSGDFLLK